MCFQDRVRERARKKERVLVVVVVVVVVAVAVSFFFLAAPGGTSTSGRVGSGRVGVGVGDDGSSPLRLSSMIRLGRPLMSLPGIPCVRVIIRQRSGVDGGASKTQRELPLAYPFYSFVHSISQSVSQLVS